MPQARAKEKKRDPRCGRKLSRWNQKPLTPEQRRRLCGTKKRTPAEKLERKKWYAKNKRRLKKQRLENWKRKSPAEKRAVQKRRKFVTDFRKNK
jgi:hypothetical protein